MDDGINPGGLWPDPIGTHNVFIIGNYVKDVAHDGIHISLGTDHVIAANNIVETCGIGVGIHLTSHFSVVNNLIKDCGRGIATLSNPAPYGVIEGNLIDGTTAGQGIFIGHENHHLRVANNICRNINSGNSVGIQVSLSDYVSVIGNTVEGASLGISTWDAEHITLIGNSLTGVQTGMVLNGSEHVVSNNALNLSAGENGKAIQLIAANGYAVSNSLVSGNYIQGTAYSYGIDLYTSGCTVSNNRIRGAGVRSIRDNVGSNKILFNDMDEDALYHAATLHIEFDDAGHARLGGALATGTGATADRPSAVTVGVGARWYDTTLSQPIWSDGSTWRDASGNVV
jgi:hypothetical protein